MNKRRLLKLADLLEADARKKRGIKFDLGVVVNVGKVGPNKEVKLDCGTTACAMGLAAISGAFARQGLSYKVESDELWPSDATIFTTINGRKREYDRAAMKVFDITFKQATFLFTPSTYENTPRGAAGERFVAQRIRNFVAGKETA